MMMQRKKKATAKKTTRYAKASRAKKSFGKKPIMPQRLKLTWFRTFAILAVLALAGIVWQSLFRPLSVTTSDRMLQINAGQTYSGLISDLAERDIFQFPLIIKIYQRLFIHDVLKAGRYNIPEQVSAFGLLNSLSHGQIFQLNKVTLIEGMTFQQLKQRLAADKEIRNTVLNLPDDQILAAANIAKNHPEGWFAPDTYFFQVDETDVNVLKHLYDEQENRIQQAWKTRDSDLPYRSINDALTMASIIEKETGVGGERAKVAAVFVNRLRLGMRLQTDPTVIYGMGDRYDGRIGKKDLQTLTSYNTYLINGLPPTPIAMPGFASIHAALHPANTKALYFVATGTGGHQFSETLAEHNAAVQRYLQVMRAKKQNPEKQGPARQASEKQGA
jgi:UPF0755 protein